MKHQIANESDRAKLQFAASSISTRTTLPILSMLKFDKGEVCSTDLDVVTGFTTPDTSAGGCVPWRQLKAALDCAESCDLEVNGKATIQTPAARVELNVLEANEFPPRRQRRDDVAQNKITFDRLELYTALKRCMVTIAKDESRYVLMNVLMECNELGTTFVSTDGRRLTQVRVPSGKGKVGVLLHHKFCAAVLEMCRSSVGHVPILVDEKHEMIFAWSDSGLFVDCKIVSGNFPNYRQVCPAQWEGEATVDAQALLKAVRAVSVCCTDKSYGVKLMLTNKQIVLSTSDASVGKATASVETSASIPLAMVLRADFMIEALEQMTGLIRLCYCDGLSPLLFEQDRNYSVVVMPMRLE